MLLVRLAKANALAERHLMDHGAISRRANELVQTELRELEISEAAEGFISSTPNEGMTLFFACECADETCHERVPIRFSEYNKLHRDRNQFIVLPEHRELEQRHITPGKMKYSIINSLWQLAA